MTLSYNPFTGYVRDPATVVDVSGPDDVIAAIGRAAARFGTPADLLRGVWQREAGGMANAYQEVGYNYAGYGGFFGLPSSMLGSLQEQADSAARILAAHRSELGSWQSALGAYTGGGYTLDEAAAADAAGIAPAPGATLSSGSSRTAAGSAGIGDVPIIGGLLKGSLLDPAVWAEAAVKIGVTVAAGALILYGTAQLARGATGGKK